MNTAPLRPLASETPGHRAPPALPGPPDRWWGLPLLREMQRDYLGFAQSLQRRWGDITVLRLGPERVVDVFAPELARELLVDHADALVRWERSTEVFAQTMGQGVLVTEGAPWQRQRRLLVPAFSPRRLADYADLMTDASRRALDALAQQAATPTGVRANLQHVLTQLTMEVILRTLFGARHPGNAETARATFEAEARDAERAVAVLVRLGLEEMMQTVPLPNWLPRRGGREKRWALDTLDRMIWRHLDARDDEARRDPAAATARRDLLAMLRAARDEGDGGQGGGLSRQELRDQCMTLFQAGHESTATGLSWWTGLMARDLPAQQRARDEVRALLGSGANARPPTLADLARLPWLSATIKEALRLYPPLAALMTRRTLRPLTLGGHRLPARTLVRVTPWVLHRDPRWFPQPLAFQPERWLDGSADAAPRGAYLPFGVGPRVCLGQHFALMEMTLVAAMLLQRLHLTAPDEPLPEPDMQVTLRPRGGLWVHARAVA